MSRSPRSTIVVPRHWTPEQALVVLECLQIMREALWTLYGSQAQQAWRDQLLDDAAPSEFDLEEFDPDAPF